MRTFLEMIPYQDFSKFTIPNFIMNLKTRVYNFGFSRQYYLTQIQVRSLTSLAHLIRNLLLEFLTSTMLDDMLPT